VQEQRSHRYELLRDFDAGEEEQAAPPQR